MWRSTVLYDKAKVDPGLVFNTPEDLAANAELTRSQKIDLLRRWAYDAKEVTVADEENMLGQDSDLLDRILKALHDLGVGLEETPEHIRAPNLG